SHDTLDNEEARCRSQPPLDRLRALLEISTSKGKDRLEAMAHNIKRVPGIRYPRCLDCNAEVISRSQWISEPCPSTGGIAGHNPKPTQAMNSWIDYRALEDLTPMMSTNNPRSHFGILSAEILHANELLPLIRDMSMDEQIIVVGKLRSLEVILQQHLMHLDP